MDFVNELWRFLISRRRVYLWPVIVMMVVLGGLLVVAKGSAVAPFIYTIF